MSTAKDGSRARKPLKELPLAVLRQARAIYERAVQQGETAHSEAIQLLDRLVSDPRMEKVWWEPYKKKRIAGRQTEEFLYSLLSKAKRARAAELRQEGGREAAVQLLELEATALERVETIPANSASAERDLAVMHFFHQVYHLALDGEPVVTRTEFGLLSQDLMDIATRSQEDAETSRSLGGKEEATELEEAASDYDEQWMEMDVDDEPLIVDRHREDRWVRGFLISLAEVNRELFGTPWYGTLATIANVALHPRNPLTGRRVIEILSVTEKKDSCSE